jgi:hypothetical protein
MQKKFRTKFFDLYIENPLGRGTFVEFESSLYKVEPNGQVRNFLVWKESTLLFLLPHGRSFFKNKIRANPRLKIILLPRAVRSTRTRSRTNTKIDSFQTTDTVLPMLPASAGATAAKVLVCFFYYAIF